MNRDEMVQWLIANSGVWKEEDREVLALLSDDKVRSLTQHAQEARGAAVVANAGLEGFEHEGKRYFFDPERVTFMVANCDMGQGMDSEEEEAAEGEEPTAPPAKKKGFPPVKNNAHPPTMDQWLQAAPPEVQGLVANYASWEKEQKAALVRQLVANQDEAAAQIYLRMPLDHLKRLAAAMPQRPTVNSPEPTFFGAAGGGNTPRQSDEDRNDILPLPTINYEELSGVRKKA